MGKSTVAEKQGEKPKKEKSILKEELYASEIRYRRLFESARDGILILDAETGKIVDVNPSLIDLLGYSKSEFTEKSIWEISAFQDINKDKFLELKQKEYVRYDDLPLLTSDGRKIHVEFVGNVYLANSIKVIQCNIRDITEHKKDECLLQESEERYRSFFENSMDGILLTNPNGEILSANQASCNMFGYSEDELIKLGRSAIVDMSDPRLSALLDDRKLKGKARGEVTLLRKDRTRFPAEISSAIFKNQEGSERTSMIIREITERKKTEKEIMNLAKFPSENPNPILRISQNSTLLYVNEAGMKQLPDWKLQTGQSVTNVLHDVIFNALNIGEVQVAEFEHFGKIYSFYVAPFVKEGYANLYGWDITERKMAEEKLQESEERFRTAAETITDVVYEWDIKQKLDWYGDIDGITGYPPGGFPRTIEGWAATVHPEDKDRVTATLEDHLKGLVTYATEYRVRRKDGEWRWWSARGTALRNERGEPYRMIGSITDISERKKIEKEIIFQADLINNVGQAVIATDLLGTVTYWNNAAEKIYGWSNAEAIGQSIMDLTPAQQSNEQAIEIMKNLREGKTWTGEFLVKGKDGHSFPAFVTDTPILDSERRLTGIIGISSDITERKQIQQKVNESEEKFRSYIENAPNGVCVTDEKGRYIEVNKSACRMLGYSKDELLNISISDILSKESFEHGMNHFKSLQHETNGKGDFLLKCKDGVGKWFTLDAVKLSETRFLGFHSDITERKQMEIDLFAAKEKAEESDRLKSAFLANMSHEIRTPMNGILGFTELLREPDLSSEQKEAYINIVNQSGQRLLNTVNDIVEISKIEAGIVTVDLKEVDVQIRLDELIQFFTPEATKKGLKLILEKEVQKTCTTIITDQNKLDSILTNLIKNAIKYTPAGEIRVGCKVKSNKLEFYVKDTGIGILKERQQAVFERFVQADIADKDARQGSGLGLAITKAYVEMLGGKVWMESREGIGSTFYFTLLLSGQAQKKTEENETGKQDEIISQIKGLNIIIAEDDENSAFFLQTILKKENNKILLTKNGHESIEACRNNPDTDLVLMDIQMPEMNGYDATREIRKFNKKVFIIAQTAFALAGDHEKAIEAGCNDYIIKPINKKVLLYKIDKLKFN